MVRLGMLFLVYSCCINIFKGVSEEEINKWRFAIVSFGRPEYLTDTDLLGKHEYTNTDYLGLEHPDTVTRVHRHVAEKPIKIFG